MAKDYYSKKVEMTKFIGLLAINGSFNLKQIEARVFERFGFGSKHVKQAIDLQIELGKWFWLGDILKDLLTYEEEVQQKWKTKQDLNNKTELDSILSTKLDK